MYVLIVGRSATVLADTKVLLHDRGYRVDVTSRFDEVLTDFDVSQLDVVVFGGQVPAETKEELMRQMRARNPEVVVVQGLAGIPGLITAQVEEALGTADPDDAVSFDPEVRHVLLSLDRPRAVVVTAWWGTAFIPPDPKSTSLVLFDGKLPAGEHEIALPGVVPSTSAFVSVELDGVSYCFATS